MEALSQVIGKADMGKRTATWTDLVLAHEKAAAAGVAVARNGSAASSTGTVQQRGSTEVKDFTRPPSSASEQRRESMRKSVQMPARQASRSAPTSPLKSGPPRQAPPPPPMTNSGSVRSKTPPMGSRRGHRSRDAVKSMIF